MQAYGREFDGVTGSEAAGGAPATAGRMQPDKIDGAPAELEPDLRKRLINLDVNPGGDI